MDSFQLFAVSLTNLKAVEELPPDYQSCATDYPWCYRLAQALVYEARGEGEIGMRAVAFVILGRAKDKGWPSTINGVIEQKKQFSYLQDMHNQVKPTKEDFDLAYKVAYDAYFGISKTPVPGARWYHSTGIKPPKWTKKLEVVETIGNHVFYKEKK